MRVFRNIAEIEKLNLASMDRRDVMQLKLDLHFAYFHTSLDDGKLSDGRHVKDAMGMQYTRVTDFLMKGITNE